MGFLSKFKGTEKLDLGDGYFIELKQHLSTLDTAYLRELESEVIFTYEGNDKTARAPKLSEAQFERVVCSVASWNLTDDNDQLLPYATKPLIRQSLEKLPDVVYTKILQAVNELKEAGSPDREDQIRFRDADVSDI